MQLFYDVTQSTTWGFLLALRALWHVNFTEQQDYIPVQPVAPRGDLILIVMSAHTLYHNKVAACTWTFQVANYWKLSKDMENNYEIIYYTQSTYQKSLFKTYFISSTVRCT